MSFSCAKTSKGYDVIGDVHGHADTLKTLLAELGYTREGTGGFTHLTNRKAIFVGDLVNRGPKVRETLEIARKMVESGSAMAILGNHEFNVLGMETKGSDGLPLRPHTRQNNTQVIRTKAAFRDYADEWSINLAWMRTLPLSLELKGLRIVHAVWHPPSLEIIAGRNFEDESFLHSAFTRKTLEAKATGITLKGMKVPLPENKGYRDRFGNERKKGRIRWWQNPNGKSYADLLFPPYQNAERNAKPPVNSLKKVVPYPEDAPPLFFGHYCLPPSEPKIHGNVVCIDGCVTCHGRLWAYRFDGEQRPDYDKLVCSG